MSTLIHTSVSVRGLLVRIATAGSALAVAEVCAGIEHEGRQASPAEVLDWLADHLAAGDEFVPIEEPCDGWNGKTGCPGHRSEEPADAGEARTKPGRWAVVHRWGDRWEPSTCSRCGWHRKFVRRRPARFVNGEWAKSRWLYRASGSRVWTPEKPKCIPMKRCPTCDGEGEVCR